MMEQIAYASVAVQVASVGISRRIGMVIVESGTSNFGVVHDSQVCAGETARFNFETNGHWQVATVSGAR
jgi:hypothetical protein